MKLITGIEEMQRWSQTRRGEGKTLVFVPTMGAFHDGHLKLMEKGKGEGDLLLVSIFLNPAQFGSGEDWLSYPGDLDKDLRMAEDAGVDMVFTPSKEAMYPEGFQTCVVVKDVTQNLCGVSRPDHFKGVATVVVKLFNIVMPHTAVFGEKDYQQLVVIKRMVKDLNLNIEIIGVPTVREKDGLAMSSRNSYLNKEERAAAASLYSSLKIGMEMFVSGVRDSLRIIDGVRRRIEEEGLTEIDYVKVCDPETIQEIDTIEDKALLALAVKIGRARLIDNCLLNREPLNYDNSKKFVGC
ncbi:MAG: pantoate--beta-alanine ligase [Thermodesulfobacteriota bacterium]